ncbi:MAG: hypothetical protein ACOCZ6_01740 [Nanoarchaeota archaeon]
MRIFHISGILLGTLILAASRFFWINICFAIAESYETLSTTTCQGFQEFFFWAGIVIIALSLLGLLFKK